MVYYMKKSDFKMHHVRPEKIEVPIVLPYPNNY